MSLVVLTPSIIENIEVKGENVQAIDPGVFLIRP